MINNANIQCFASLHWAKSTGPSKHFYKFRDLPNFRILLTVGDIVVERVLSIDQRRRPQLWRNIGMHHLMIRLRQDLHQLAVGVGVHIDNSDVEARAKRTFRTNRPSPPKLRPMVSPPSGPPTPPLSSLGAASTSSRHSYCGSLTGSG
jgi:hypothetical protein